MRTWTIRRFNVPTFLLLVIASIFLAPALLLLVITSLLTKLNIPLNIDKVNFSKTFMILFLDAVIRLMFLLTTALNWLLHKFLLLAEIFAFLFKTRIVVFTLFFDRLHLGDQRFGISWLQNSSTSVWCLILWIIENRWIYYLFMPDMFWHLVGVVFRILFFWPLSSTALVFSTVEGAYSNFLLLLIIISLKLLLIQTTYALLEWAVLFYSLRYRLEVESQISCLIKGCV